VVGDPERGARGRALGHAVATELVGLRGDEQLQVRPDDLAFLAERARDERDLGVRLGGVVRDGAARGEGLVVGMRVDEQQPSGQVSRTLGSRIA
jgi:hypothetical protein